MKQAKIGNLYIGLESFDDNVLKLLNKQQDRESIEKAVKKIKSFGLNVLGSFVLGSDSDTVESIRKTIDAAIEQDVDYRLIPTERVPRVQRPDDSANRFFIPTWDKLDGNFVIFLPKNMKPSTLQREVSASYKRFSSPKQILRAGSTKILRCPQTPRIRHPGLGDQKGHQQVGRLLRGHRRPVPRRERAVDRVHAGRRRRPPRPIPRLLHGRRAGERGDWWGLGVGVLV